MSYDLRSEMAAFEARAEIARADAERGARRQIVLYAVLVIFLLSYLGWAWNRLAPFADPGYSARVAADVVGLRIGLLIEEFAESAKDSAPSVVRELELQVLGVVPKFRGQLESYLAKDMRGSVGGLLSDGDQRLVEILKGAPNGAALVAEANANAGGAAVIVKTWRAAPEPDTASEAARSRQLAIGLRDTVRKLAANRRLTPSESAQRRMLQLIVQQAAAPAPAPPPAVVK